MAKVNTDTILNVEQAENMIQSIHVFIQRKYAEIGESYCKLHMDDPEEALKDAVAQVAEANEDIAACNRRILTLRGLAECENCGAHVAIDSFFCNKCGHQMKELPKPDPIPEPEPAPVPESEPETAPAPDAAPVPEAVPEPAPIPAPMPERKAEPASAPICATCGCLLKAGAKFCIRCGSPVPEKPQQPSAPAPVKAEPAVPAEVCPKCGSPVKPGMKFCVRCGAQLAAQSQPAAQSAAEQPAVRRCRNCGKEFKSPTTRFCTGCGSKLD